VSAHSTPTLTGYLRSPRSYTYSFGFGPHVKLNQEVGQRRSFVLRAGTTLTFGGIFGWECQSTLRTPNFSCSQLTETGVVLAPVLTLWASRALTVTTDKPPVLQSIDGGARLYTWPQG
jgi:hypothetical protein